MHAGSPEFGDEREQRAYDAHAVVLKLDCPAAPLACAVR